MHVPTGHTVLPTREGRGSGSSSEQTVGSAPGNEDHYKDSDVTADAEGCVTPFRSGTCLHCSSSLPPSPSELQAGSAANVGYDFLTLRYTLHDRHNDSVQLTIDSVSSPRYTKYCVQDAISCDRDMRRCGLLQHSLLTYSSFVDAAGTRPSAQVGYSPTNSAFQLGSRGS